MEIALIDLIRKSKTNATIVEYVRRDFGVDWTYLRDESYRTFVKLSFTLDRNLVDCEYQRNKIFEHNGRIKVWPLSF